VKLTEVYIDGFRNIKNTRLDFSAEPMIVLLAPNSFGKSNLLLGIKFGFDLISKQGTQVKKHIQDSDTYADWNAEGKHTFTFGVKFWENDKQGNLGRYTYQYSLECTLEAKSSCGDDKGQGLSRVVSHRISDEFLRFATEAEVDVDEKTEGHTRFERSEKEINVLLPNGTRRSIINVKYNTCDDFVFNLGLHKLGYMDVIGELDAGDEIRTILQEISAVLRDLTVENFGDIICDERSDYLAHGFLSQDAVKIYKRNKDVYYYFVEEFKNLFQHYCHDKDKEKGVELISLGDSGQYQLIFHDNRKEKKEMIRTISYGTRRVFKLLSQIISNESPLISLEDIELGLHQELYAKVVHVLLRVLDNNKYFRKTKEQRRHEPRLIITSHAPGIVNAFGSNLDSIYLPVPPMDSEDLGGARFAKLSQAGKDELNDKKYLNYYDKGNIIFGLFFDQDRRDELRKWLEI